MLLTERKLFVPEPDRFHAVEPTKGRKLWTRRTNGGEVIGWACDEDLLVLNTAGQRSHAGRHRQAQRGALQARRTSNGRLLWEYEYGRDLADLAPYRRGGFNAIAAPVLTPSMVFVSGLDGRVCALERRTGKLVGVLDLGEPIVSVALLEPAALIVTTYPGTIARVEGSLG